MRALCGAIIMAGALIGMGLAAIGMGTRYSALPTKDLENNLTWIKFHQMDTPLMYVLVVLTICLVIGLVIAFLGLAYHHERRLREWHHMTGGHRVDDHIPVRP